VTVILLRIFILDIQKLVGGIRVKFLVENPSMPPPLIPVFHHSEEVSESYPGQQYFNSRRNQMAPTHNSNMGECNRSLYNAERFSKSSTAISNVLR
jgi:hypothetical protein